MFSSPASSSLQPHLDSWRESREQNMFSSPASSSLQPHLDSWREPREQKELQDRIKELSYYFKCVEEQKAKRSPKLSSTPAPRENSRMSDSSFSKAPEMQSKVSSREGTLDQEAHNRSMQGVHGQELLLAHQESLRSFIRQELRNATASLSTAIKTAQDQCLANLEDIQNVLRNQDTHLQERRSNGAAAAPAAAGQEAVPQLPANGVFTPTRTLSVPKVQRQTSVEEVHWCDVQEAIKKDDMKDLYLPALQEVQEARSCWHSLLGSCGLDGGLLTKHPDNWLANIVRSGWFTLVQALLIMANTTIMAGETNYAITSVLDGKEVTEHDHVKLLNLIFNLVFAAELILRIFALRSWFFIDPSEWGWNLFDTFVVISSLAFEFLVDINLTWIRTLRIFRAVRVARIIRVLRFFRELRKMLFAIMACISSLIWCFVFLALTIFMCAILMLQGLQDALKAMDYSSTEYERAVFEAKRWFSDLPQAMATILATSTGVVDWITVNKALEPAGIVYSAVLVLYVHFVSLGVMNVLTGVFLASAGEFTDHHLIVQDESVKVDGFVKQMLHLFSDLDIEGTGKIKWPMFCKAMTTPEVQIYLSSHQLEPNHARLIFDLLDTQQEGEVGMYEFVIGLLRLKGEAKTIDARIIQREISMLPSILLGESLPSALPTSPRQGANAGRMEEQSTLI